jgi:hypothetical protein
MSRLTAATTLLMFVTNSAFGQDVERLSVVLRDLRRVKGFSEQTAKEDLVLLRRVSEEMSSEFSEICNQKSIRAEEKLEFLASIWLQLRAGRGVPSDEQLKRSDIYTTAKAMVPITIESTPNGAEIFFFEIRAAAGKTNSRKWLRPGEVIIRLEKPGFTPLEEKYKVPAQADTFSRILQPS